MDKNHWLKSFPGAVTVCDRQGIILAMNDQSLKVFAADGGKQLIGSNLLDCHPEPARSKLLSMMETRQVNIYTIEKAGLKKLIYQAPWYEDGEYAGFIELSLPIPFEMPHFVRDAGK
jgi:transcriptional regulator with PAS, ATPase and Fis domain